MRYLVTGAAGFIGSQLAAALAAEGHDVVGVDSFTDYYDVGDKERNADGLDVRRLDLADERLELGGVDGVFHLAGQPGVRSFGEAFPHYVRRNILATQQVFEACVDAGVRVVFSSSSSVYGDAESYPTPEDAQPQPLSPYGVTKLACEHLARAYAQSFSLDAVVLRYFTVYGPRQRPDMAFHKFIKAAIKNDAIALYGDGEQTRDFTFVSDAVAATIAAGEHGVPGRAYNVGGGSRVSMNEVIRIIEAVAGHPLKVHREETQKGDMRDTYADTSLARKDLGFEPKVPLTEGIQAEYRWLTSSLALLESAGR